MEVLQHPGLENLNGFRLCSRAVAQSQEKPDGSLLPRRLPSRGQAAAQSQDKSDQFLLHWYLTSCDQAAPAIKCESFELRCLVNLSKAYLPVPPPPAPARAIASLTKSRHVLRANPKVTLEQSKRFASGALEHYNKGKKDKFELVDVMPVIMMSESGRRYTHVNFTAKSSKEGSPEKLFFAELHNCGKSRARSGFLVTFCEPLGSDTTVGHKGFELDTKTRKTVDFTRCFGCSPRIIHPKRGYVAGHCSIPYAYDSRC